MKKYKLILIIVIFAVISLLLLFGIYKIFFEKENYVYEGIKYDLTEDIAIQIGKIILLNKFSEGSGLNEETQFCADDNGDSWIISNYKEDLYDENGKYIFSCGGVYWVEIKKNGEILRVGIGD